MRWPKVLKSDTVIAHGIQGHAQNVADVVDKLYFPDGQEDQKIIKGNDQNHSIEHAIQIIFVEGIVDKAVNGPQRDANVGELVGSYLEEVRLNALALHIHQHLKVLVHEVAIVKKPVIAQFHFSKSAVREGNVGL